MADADSWAEQGKDTESAAPIGRVSSSVDSSSRVLVTISEKLREGDDWIEHKAWVPEAEEEEDPMKELRAARRKANSIFDEVGRNR